MPFPNSAAVRAGRFTATRPIGGGAHGRVYFARDNLGRAVAVKEALPGDESFVVLRARFRTEARVQAAIQHPAVVPVYQLEEDEASGELYLVCAYADAGSLADRLTRGPLSAEEALLVARDIGAALEATWALRIVHRDVKPSNILLFNESGPGGLATRARLGDFGVAQDQRRRRTTLIHGGSHPGTPLYMAPEQANLANVLDVRADIYALGASLWEALTGEDYKLIAAEGVPSLTRLRPDLPSGLGDALAGALAEDREARYRTPLELAQAVELALRPGSVLARETIALGRGAASRARRDPQVALAEQPSLPTAPSPAPLAKANGDSSIVVEPLSQPRLLPRLGAIAVSLFLALVSGVLWASLETPGRALALAVSLSIFAALLLFQRATLALRHRVALAIGWFACSIGSFRAFITGEALTGSGSLIESTAAQFLGLLLVLGSAVWIRLAGAGEAGSPRTTHAWIRPRAVRARGIVSGLCAAALLAHLPLLLDVQARNQPVVSFSLLASLALVVAVGWWRGLGRGRWLQLLVAGLAVAAGTLHAGLGFADGLKAVLALGTVAIGLAGVGLALGGRDELAPSSRSQNDGAR